MEDREQVYKSKLIELDLLPIELRFVYGDLKLFHKLDHNKETCVELPDYLELIPLRMLFQGLKNQRPAGYVRLTRIHFTLFALLRIWSSQCLHTVVKCGSAPVLNTSRVRHPLILQKFSRR